MNYLCVSLIWLIVLSPAAIAAPNISSIYDDAKLTKEKPRLEGRVRAIWKEIQKNLTRKERAGLSEVRLEFPLVGREMEFPLVGKKCDPMDFYSDPKTGTVFLPVHSLTFFEDLCTAYAWLWANGHSLETVDEYVAMLKYRKTNDFEGQRYPPPLDALRIPDNALTDHKVDELSLRFRNSGFAFMLAHELGHVYYHHPGYEGVPRKKAKSNEEEADSFALEIMRRTVTIPMGATLYFQATAFYLPNGGDFKSDREWEVWLESRATHPLNAHRLRTLAGQLDADSESFLVHEKDKKAAIERIRFIALKISDVAKILEDKEVQQEMVRRVKNIDISSWPPIDR